MKTKSFLLVLGIALMLSGCFVFSFYPLYTKEDLFANNLLLGKWMDNDSATWKFEYKPEKWFNPGGNIKLDSTVYSLTVKDKGEKEYSNESISVRIVKLEGNLFLDFFLDNYPEHNNESKFGMYLVPAHVFAKLEMNEDKAVIKYFNPEWLAKLIQENKIRIHHEKTDDRILLTAKPEELQKFVLKYVNSEDAFEEEYTVNLTKQ